jgi:hypothetical protein
MVSITAFPPDRIVNRTRGDASPVRNVAALKAGPESDDDYRHRMRENLFAALVVAVLLTFGVWLVGVMVDNQKAHGCYTSGDRFCSLI